MTNKINNQSIIPSTDVIQLTFDSENDYHTGFRNVSHCPIQDYVHLNDQTQPTFEMTHGFKPFTDSKIFNKVIHERWEISYVKLAQINFSSAH